MRGSIAPLQKLNRSLAKRWNARLFDMGNADNRQVLWADTIKRLTCADAAACLNALLGPSCPVTDEDVRELWNELTQAEVLQQSLTAHAHVLEPHRRATLERLKAEPLFLYIAVRLHQPSMIVETGCATGWSSALMLLALHRNQRGHLYTIDLPPIAGQGSMDWTLPQKLSVGFLVPPALRDRWTLLIGDARVKLPPLLEQVRQVDMFHHDSDHTYHHMMWEYTSVWPYLSAGGLLVSDDIGWNTAFWDFCTAVNRRAVIHASNTNFGALRR